MASDESRETRVGKQRTFRFERIEAWKLARVFNRSVYKTTRGLPKEELFELSAQLRRASVSVSSNIAEGSGRNSEVAYGPLMEVVSQIFIALDEGYIAQAEFDHLAQQADLLAGKIVALSKSLGRRPRITPPPSRP